MIGLIFFFCGIATVATVQRRTTEPALLKQNSKTKAMFWSHYATILCSTLLCPIPTMLLKECNHTCIFHQLPSKLFVHPLYGHYTILTQAGLQYYPTNTNT